MTKEGGHKNKHPNPFAEQRQRPLFFERRELCRECATPTRCLGED